MENSYHHHDRILCKVVPYQIENNKIKILLGYSPKFMEWSLLGGGKKLHESPLQAMCREMIEESCGVFNEFKSLKFYRVIKMPRKIKNKIHIYKQLYYKLYPKYYSNEYTALEFVDIDKITPKDTFIDDFLLLKKKLNINSETLTHVRYTHNFVKDKSVANLDL